MRLGAVQRRARKLVRPGPRADERHERTRRSFPDLEVAVGLPGCDNQDLPVPRADRGDDSSPGRELVPPWIRDLRGAGGRQDAVVRSLLGIAETAISDDDGHACVAGPGEVRPPHSASRGTRSIDTTFSGPTMCATRAAWYPDPVPISST